MLLTETVFHMFDAVMADAACLGRTYSVGTWRRAADGWSSSFRYIVQNVNGAHGVRFSFDGRYVTVTVGDWNSASSRDRSMTFPMDTDTFAVAEYLDDLLLARAADLRHG